MSSIPSNDQYQMASIDNNSTVSLPKQDGYLYQANFRLCQKVNSVFSQTAKPIYPVNWDNQRAFTPGGLCGYRNQNGLGFIDFYGNGYVKLFSVKNEAQGLYEIQGLFFQDHQAVGASVSTEVKNESIRNHERNLTFVQYDKDNFIIFDGCDFEPKPTYLNAKGKQIAAYQGSHRIDYLFGSPESHIEPQNYFPGDHFYNQSLKKYLVNRSDNFVEITLYTSTPALAPTKSTYKDQNGSAHLYHPFPIGMIFIQLKKNNNLDAFQDNYSTQDIYFFPNINFNYESLTSSSTAIATKAEKTIPFFKLKKNLHVFFQPAIIYDFSHLEQGLEKQVEEEKRFLKIIEDISSGMSLDQHGEYNFLFDALYKKVIDPRKIWECDAQIDFFEKQPCSQPLISLCEFLVKYVLINALKSEVITAKIRLIFTNTVANLIQRHKMDDPEKPELTKEVIDFIQSLEKEFPCFLQELNNLAPNMTLEELVFLGYIYKTLSDGLSS
ncbi:MAG: hypothetical protein WCT85_06485, partial [Parachlamydiales bacterium]